MTPRGMRTFRHLGCIKKKEIFIYKNITDGEGNGNLHQIFLSGKWHGQREPGSESTGSQELDTTEQLNHHHLGHWASV